MKERAVANKAPGHDTKARTGTYMPIDEMAERSVISGLLTSPESYLDVSLILSVEDFGLVAMANIYRAIQICDNTGRPFDQVTVGDELKRQRQLTSVGGHDGLGALVAGATLVDNILAHADVVLEKARLRRLISAGRAITSDGLAPEAVGAAVLERAEKVIFDLGKAKSESSLVPMSQAVPLLMKEIAQIRDSSALLGMPTSIPRLDEMTAGLQGGQLVILAARPGVGKSALALQMAVHMARVTAKTVIFNSYEMSKPELTIRMLSSAIDFDGHRLRSGDIPDEVQRPMAVAAEKMAELPLFIDDNPPLTITSFRSAMRRMAARCEMGAIFVDYLQLMQGDGRTRDVNRTQEVGDISRGLKLLATELHIPIIALSQLSRAVESRINKRPMLSDLRESGSLEQDANVVLFIYREGLYSPMAPAEEGELIIAKQRSGPVGTIGLHVSGSSSRITQAELAPQGRGYTNSGNSREPF
jgi:replicative DNA helicase